MQGNWVKLSFDFDLTYSQRTLSSLKVQCPKFEKCLFFLHCSIQIPAVELPCVAESSEYRLISLGSS